MTHDELVEEAKEAVNAVFSDRSVDQQQTIESLTGLRDEIDTMVDAIERDVERDAERSNGDDDNDDAAS